MGYDPGDWADFGLGILVAGAVLAGLAILTFAGHARTIRASTRLAAQAAGAVILPATSLAAGALVLIPGEGRVRLGVELAFLAAIAAGVLGWLASRGTAGGGDPRSAGSAEPQPGPPQPQPSAAQPPPGSAEPRTAGSGSLSSGAVVGRFASVATLLLLAATSVSLLTGIGGGLLWLVGASLAGLLGGLAVTWLTVLELG